MPPASLALGVAAALGAGLLWGLVFVLPLLLPTYPPALLAFGRYLAFGLVTLPIAFAFRADLRALGVGDWLEAVKLALVGNLIYYLALAAAIRLAGAPLPTLIIGTLPVVIAVVANLGTRSFSWSMLMPSLMLIAGGMAFVHADQWMRLEAGNSERYLSGAALAWIAVAAWTWYPIRNARWLRSHPGRRPLAWATAQGLATLPLAAIGYVLFMLFAGVTDPYAWLAPGESPVRFWFLMTIVGLGASWLGTWLWNVASQHTDTALTGQLIVFETVAALVYVYFVYARWPSPAEAVGIALLIAGVVVGVRRLARPYLRRPVAMRASDPE